MTLPDWVSVTLPLAGLVTGLAVWFKYDVAGLKQDIFTVRSNDMAHMDAKLDGIMEGIKRLESRLDSHLYWHLDGPAKAPRT